MLIVSVFILGAIVGSFLNVVAYRYNTGRSLGGRSGCLSCSKRLRWYELVPILSYLFQNGRCRGCRAKLSLQYPIVELATAILFTIIFWQYAGDLLLALYYWVIVSILIVITVYDLRHTIIPDGLVYAFIVLALLRPAIVLKTLITGPIYLVALKASLFAGGIFFIFFASIWLLSRGRAMGFGDAKLALGIGVLLGLEQGIVALIIAFWTGAIVGVTLIIASKIGRVAAFRRLLGRPKYFTMKSEIPFAPFLILGLLVALLTTTNAFPF